jgi:hypothetical protein
MPMIGAAGVGAGIGAGAALGLLVLTEAGLPVLIPADLLSSSWATRAGLVLLVVAVVVAAAGAIVWFLRRGRETGARSLEEATSPACLIVGAVADQRLG